MSTPKRKLITPKIGVHLNIPAEEYHGWFGASASRLNTAFAKSFGHLKAEMDGLVVEDSGCLRLGDAAHAALLEPEKFEAQYAIGPDVKLNTKAGIALWAEFEAANKGKHLIRGKDGVAVLGIRQAAWAHPAASAILRKRSHTEASIVWIDPVTGVLCKMRADLLCQSIRILADLKTTIDASAGAFAGSINYWGYHRQFAHYHAGLRANGMDFDLTTIIAVEKTAPYAVQVFELHEDDLELGRVQMDALLAKYAECQRTSIWPFYSDHIQKIQLAEYHRKASWTKLRMEGIAA